MVDISEKVKDRAGFCQPICMILHNSDLVSVIRSWSVLQLCCLNCRRRQPYNV